MDGNFFGYPEDKKDEEQKNKPATSSREDAYGYDNREGAYTYDRYADRENVNTYYGSREDAYGYNSRDLGRKEELEEPLSVGEWILTLIVLMIPVVNFVMLLFWAFGDGNISRKRFCQASLIVGIIAFILFVIFMIACIAMSIAMEA